MSAIQVFQSIYVSLNQGAINAILQKSDPYTAITFIRNIMALIPPDKRPSEKQIEDECGELPAWKDFTDDPDFTIIDRQAMEYYRKYSYMVLDAFSKYAEDEMSKTRM